MYYNMFNPDQLHIAFGMRSSQSVDPHLCRPATSFQKRMQLTMEVSLELELVIEPKYMHESVVWNAAENFRPCTSHVHHHLSQSLWRCLDKMQSIRNLTTINWTPRGTPQIVSQRTRFYIYRNHAPFCTLVLSDTC